MCKNPKSEPRGGAVKTKLKHISKIVGVVLALLMATAGTTAFILARASAIPDNLNMSSSMDGMEGMGDMSGMSMPDMGTPAPNAVLMSTLDQPPTLAPVKAFTLTAETAQVNLGSQVVSAFTYNGALPGPELRVTQGNLVVVTLINHLPESTTIHWHGLSVPNAEDGVAGVTQDAVKPGQS